MKKTYEKLEIIVVICKEPTLMLDVSQKVHSYKKGEDITVGDVDEL